MSGLSQEETSARIYRLDKQENTEDYWDPTSPRDINVPRMESFSVGDELYMNFRAVIVLVIIAIVLLSMTLAEQVSTYVTETT
jgi:hypothetical protein